MVSLCRRYATLDVHFGLVLMSAELALSALLALNLVQAVFALKYPRKPLPPLPTSPAKGLVTPQSQKKRRTILAPGVRFFLLMHLDSQLLNHIVDVLEING